MTTELNQMKRNSLTLLKDLYETQYGDDNINYDDVDDFYAHLGYDLQLEKMLHSFNVKGTSDLVELLADMENDPSFESKLFEYKWLIPEYTYNILKELRKSAMARKLNLSINQVQAEKAHITIDINEKPIEILTIDPTLAIAQPAIVLGFIQFIDFERFIKLLKLRKQAERCTDHNMYDQIIDDINQFKDAMCNLNLDETHSYTEFEMIERLELMGYNLQSENETLDISEIAINEGHVWDELMQLWYTSQN